jgi:copper chaperone CopZ
MKKYVSAFGLLLTLTPALMAAHHPSTGTTSKSAKTLAPGTYSATVKALVCEGCPPLVTEALSKQKGIDKISVDPKTSTAKFTVLKNSQVSLAELQKALDAAAGEMGMGADYTLKNLKRVSS